MTQSQEEPVEIFMNLGLTYVQAKLYLTLARLGDSGGEVKKICQDSCVARQDIYRVLPRLQKLGLAEKIISKPVSFRAIPLEKGFSMLLNKKTSEYEELKKKAKTVLKKISEGSPKGDIGGESFYFAITSERGLFFNRLREMIEKTQSSMCIIYAKERMSTVTFHVGEQIERGIGKGLKIKALTTKTEGEETERNLRLLSNKLAFDLRFVEDIPVGLTIFDRKEVNIRIGKTLVPCLWTNNPNVVKLAESYFDNSWKTAQIEKNV